MNTDAHALPQLETYTFIEQNTFAQMSGDHNPIHVDSVAARRTQAGEPVVHGMHTVLKCLESLSIHFSSEKEIASISAQFNNPILLMDTVVFVITKYENQKIQVTATVGKSKLASITVIFGRKNTIRNVQKSPPSTILANPKKIEFTEIQNQKGYIFIPATDDEITALFPRSVHWIGVNAVRDMMTMSTLVGMECPGLNSLFANFSIELYSGTQSDGLKYAVSNTDTRFRLISMEIDGRSISGSISAFMRMPPTQQAKVSSIRERIKQNEFDKQNALIIGGSRGLGEVTAKIISAGGGNSTISYSTGKEDALKISTEISASGSNCNIEHFDIFENISEQLDNIETSPTHIYFFATPKIFRRKTNIFEPETFSLFNTFYVNGFFQLCHWASTLPHKKIKIFYPSTTALNERPMGITEYAMSKAGGEELCKDLPKTLTNLAISVERLPRILTDQTATVSTRNGEDPIEILLPIIRRMNG